MMNLIKCPKCNGDHLIKFNAEEVVRMLMQDEWLIRKDFELQGALALCMNIDCMAIWHEKNGWQTRKNSTGHHLEEKAKEKR